MPNGGANAEAVQENVESSPAPFDDAWNDIQESASIDPELGRRYTILYVAQHGGRTYHDYSEYLKTGERAGLIDEIAGFLGPRGKAYKDVIAKTLGELSGGNAGVLPDPSRANTSAAGEPIVMFSGGFAHQSDDLHVNGAGIDFIFRRTYRNQSILFGPLGANWDHAYDLRLVESGDVLRLKAGDLREHVYKRHPRFGQSGFDYFVPPDGQHSIVVPIGDSFASRGPDGLMTIFERSELADVHRLDRIEDRYGNFLLFLYRASDGLLDRVLVNHPDRIVRFEYDATGRIVAVRDYAGRAWRYGYDDFGDLVAITTPGTDRYPAGLTTTHEYSTAQTVGLSQHNLLRVIDPAGQLYLENEYGTAVGTIEFNRVTRQRLGAGESFFSYQNIDPVFEADYTPEQRPAHQTNFIDRNGHEIHFVYNRFGNLLLQEEYVREGGRLRFLQWRHRYSRDGELTATLSPEGVVTQHLFGRADFVQRNGIEDEDEVGTHDALTAHERLAFGRQLATVRRGRYYTFAELSLARAAWGDVFPDVFGATDPADIIVKFTYEPAYGQIETSSDSRTTESADPRDPESAEYQAGLTRYEYDGPAGDTTLFLRRIRHPTPTLADGTAGNPIIEEFTAYDTRGRLLRKIDAEGGVTEHAYFGPGDGVLEGHLRETVVDPADLAIATRFEADELGRVVAVHHPRALGGAPGSFVTRHAYNELDQLIETISSLPYAFTWRRFYDANGKLEREQRDAEDESGAALPDAPAVRTCRYDSELNLVRETVGGATLSAHLVTKHDYDSAGLRVRTISPGGSRMRTSYDERKQPVAVTRGAGTQDASTTRTVYDGDGRVRSTISARGHPVELVRDPFGRIVRKVDALGHVTCLAYDKSSNLHSERVFGRRPDASFALLSRTENTFDQLGRVTQTARSLYDDPLPVPSNETLEDAFLVGPVGTDVTSRTFYDGRNRVVRKVDPLARSHTFEYDALDRVVLGEDPLGNRIESRYDAHGNLVRKDVRDLVRDPVTNAVLGERVFTTSMVYDELDRKIAETDSLGNTTRYDYDSRNNEVQRVDPLGNVIRSEYDTHRRQVAEIAENTDTGLGGGTALPPAITRSEYDANGNLVALVDPLGRVTRQGFDALDRRREIVYPDGSRSRYDYDADGNLVGIEDANGLRRVLTVDGMGRTTRVEIDRGGVVPGLVVEGAQVTTFAYDGLGRRRHEENEFAHCDVRFDSLGRPIEESFSLAAHGAAPAATFVLSRTYDDAGMLSQLTFPGGRVLRFERDELDRLTLIANLARGNGYPGHAGTPDAHEIAAFTYAGRQRDTNVLGNGASVRYAHDGAGRIVEITHESRGSSLLQMQYLHDAAGNVRVRNDIASTALAGERFGYDSFYRLTRAESRDDLPVFNAAALAPATAPPPDPIPDRQSMIDGLIGNLQPAPPATWEYDQSGNRRLERAGGGGTTAYAANDLDQYVAVDATSFSYDRNGNLIRGEGRERRYDSMNRLVRVIELANGDDVAQFLYDARGRRVIERHDDVTTQLIYDGSTLVAEYRDGDLFAQYVHDDGVDKPLELAAEGAEHWYHPDLAGSTRILSDATGAEEAAFRYTPFGELVDPQPAGIFSPLLYIGRRLDASIDSYDFRARTYDPRLGRFLQRDPAGTVDGINLYRYAGDNPLTYTDPTGTVRQQVRADVSYSHRDIASTNYTLKGRYEYPDDLTLGFATDLPFRFLGVGWRGLVAHGTYFPVPGTKWQRAGGLRLGVATELELDVDWRPSPLVLDLSLSGSAIAQNYKPGDLLGRLGIAGGRASASGSAELHIDFGRFGNYRIATPVDLELRSRLTAAGLLFEAKYGAGTKLARSERSYEGRVGFSLDQGPYARVTKVEETDYGIGFYERVPKLKGTSDPHPLIPGWKYLSAPTVPNAEDRPRNNVDIEWERYVGLGYRRRTTTIGRSRLEWSLSLGIGVNDQYFPDSFVLSGLFKYALW